MRKQQGMTLSHVRRLDGVNRWKNKDLNKLKMFCDYLLRIRCRPKFQKDSPSPQEGEQITTAWLAEFGALWEETRDGFSEERLFQTELGSIQFCQTKRLKESISSKTEEGTDKGNQGQCRKNGESLA